MSELTKRVLFVVVAIPIVGAIVWVGRLPLALLLSVAAALGAWEFNRLSTASGVTPQGNYTILLAAAIPLLVHRASTGGTLPPVWLVALLVPLLLLQSLKSFAILGSPVQSVAATLFGAWYTGGMLAFAYALRHSRFTISDAAGTALVALPLVLTWMTDIGAFFIGRWLGGPKLLPSVSPGKTVSGAIGGLIVAVVTAALFVNLVLLPYARLGMTLASTVLFGAIISLAAQAGDLAESMLKRQANMKDSSTLIPGHGGVLDRLDALLFTLPLAFALLGPFLSVGP